MLSLWYYPEPVGKPHELAVQLTQRGHDITVITGFPNYPAGRVYEGYRRRFRYWQTLDGVRVLRVPHVIDRSQSAIRRVISYTSFALSAALVGGPTVGRSDVIWTYQIGLPGVILSTFKGTPLVHEVQDLWPEWGHTADLGLKGWQYRLLERQERCIYGRARAVITISSGFRRALMTKGVPATRLTVIPNWANEERFRPVPRDPELGQREGLACRFNVVYAGNVGTAQGLSIVLDAAGLLSDLPRVQFVMVGEGVERQALQDMAAKRELHNVRFLGSRPPDWMAGYLAYANVVLLPLLRDPIYEITIPSKTYAYLASGRPILVSAAGDAADLVSNAGAGLVCPPEDPTALAEAVRRFYAMAPEEREAMGRAGRETFLANYTRAALVDRYETLLDAVVARPNERGC